jgi:chromosome segregation ATPase
MTITETITDQRQNSWRIAGFVPDLSTFSHGQLEKYYQGAVPLWRTFSSQIDPGEDTADLAESLEDDNRTEYAVLSVDPLPSGEDSQENGEAIAPSIIQIASARGNLIQVGRDYIRYIKFNIESGNVTIVALNALAVVAFMSVLTVGVAHSVTYVAQKLNLPVLVGENPPADPSKSGENRGQQLEMLEQELAVLRSQLGDIDPDLKIRVKRLEDELKAVSGQLDNDSFSSEALVDIRSQLDVLQREVGTLRDQLPQWSPQANDGLRTDLNTVAADLTQLRRELAERVGQTDANSPNRQRLDTLDRRLQELQGQLVQTDGRIQEQLTQLTAELQEVASRSGLAETEIQGRMETIETQLSELSSQVQEQLASARAEMESVTNQIRQLDSTSQQQFTAIAGQIAQLSEQSEQLSATVQQSSERLVSLEESMGSFEGRLGELANQDAQFQSALEEVTARLDAELSRQRDKDAELEGRIQSLENRVSSLENRVVVPNPDPSPSPPQLTAPQQVNPISPVVPPPVAPLF